MVDQSPISDFGVIWAQLSLQFPDTNLVSEHLYMGNHLHYLYHHCGLAPLCIPYWEYAGELPISVSFILHDVFFLGSCYFRNVTNVHTKFGQTCERKKEIAYWRESSTCR